MGARRSDSGKYAETPTTSTHRHGPALKIESQLAWYTSFPANRRLATSVTRCHRCCWFCTSAARTRPPSSALRRTGPRGRTAYHLLVRDQNASASRGVKSPRQGSRRSSNETSGSGCGEARAPGLRGGGRTTASGVVPAGRQTDDLSSGSSSHQTSTMTVSSPRQRTRRARRGPPLAVVLRGDPHPNDARERRSRLDGTATVRTEPPKCSAQSAARRRVTCATPRGTLPPGLPARSPCRDRGRRTAVAPRRPHCPATPPVRSPGLPAYAPHCTPAVITYDPLGAAR